MIARDYNPIAKTLKKKKKQFDFARKMSRKDG